MKSLLKLGVFAALAILSVAIARADDTTTWYWNYDGTGVTASGAMTVSDTPDTAYPGGYDILSITGQRNGDAITGLVPPSGTTTNTGVVIYDNVFYPSQSPTFFDDIGGLLYSVGTTDYNIYQGNGEFGVSGSDYEYTVGGATPGPEVTFSASETPEPNSLLLLGTGLLGLAGLISLRKHAQKLM